MARPKPSRLVGLGGAIGTNLTGPSDWSPEWFTVDLMKLSRPWISGNAQQWDDGRPLELDEQGWVRRLAPGQLARTLMMWDRLAAPSGPYVVLYDGEGQIEYMVPGDKIKRERPGRDVVLLDPAKQGLGLLITATNPKNHLRNIRVVMPGAACRDDRARACDAERPCAKGSCLPFDNDPQAQRFHPLFLERIAGYGVLRFMDWMATNGSEQRRWDDRPKPTDVRWTGKGVPVEVMVELANRTKKDPWFTMPHLADDDYVRRFASYVRDHLDRDRRVFVEHSNEVWNGGFAQAHHAKKMGLAAGLSRNEFEAQLRYHARRSKEIFRIWQKTFSDRPGLVRVLGAMAASTWATETMLGFEAMAEETDALAIAPYFGGELGTEKHQARVARMSVEQLLAELEGPALTEAVGWMRGQAALARRFGVDLIAYEGGQHLSGVGPPMDDARVNALFDAANRHARMKGLYLRYLQAWRESGGKLFVHFSSCGPYTKFGRWGALETLFQPRSAAPKFDALTEFAEKNAPWW